MAISSTIIEETVQKYGSALVLYARQFFVGRNLHAAEDVVQEVFHRLSRQAEMPASLSGWLYTAVRNAAISAARSEKRRTRREVEHELPMFQPDDESPLDVEAIVLRLEKLDAEEREIVVLHIWSDLPFGGIAALLGGTKTTVFRRYKEALETLRAMIEYDR